jgi:hypothetical protein
MNEARSNATALWDSPGVGAELKQHETGSEPQQQCDDQGSTRGDLGQACWGHGSVPM